MKQLNFKEEFKGLGNALNLIPEGHKKDGNTFLMTDGNEKYKIRWEGTLEEGRAVVITATDKKLVNEDIDKMKHLMGYKSTDSQSSLSGVERISENSTFGDILNKTKSLLGESEEK